MTSRFIDDKGIAAVSATSWAHGAMFVLVFVLWHLEVPVRAPGNALDPSWHMVLHDAHVQARSFGSELSFTYGPAGYLLSPYYFEDTFARQFAYRIALHALGGVLLWPLLRRAGWALRLLLGAGLFAFALPIDVAVPVYLAAAACGLFSSLGEKPIAFWSLGAAVALVALVAVAKFTFLLLAVALGFCLLLRGLLAAGRERRSFLAGGMLVLFAVPAAWCGSGQPAADFFRYLADARALSAGYTDAMSLETPVVEGRLLVLSLVLILVVLAASCPLPERWTECGRAIPVIFLLFVAFLLWKHSAVRSDFGHLFILPAALFPALCGWLASRPTTVRTKPWLVATLVVLLGATAVLVARCGGTFGVVGALRSMAILSHLGSAREESARSVDAERRKAELPVLKSLIGNAEVDVFGDLQAGAILNGLRYSPRPSFQSYCAYHPRLIDRNEAFYLSEAAPPFVLVTLTDLDGRYPAISDAKALRALLHRYHPVAFEAPYLLMKANESVRPMGRMVKLGEAVATSGEAVAVPEVEPGSGVWVRVEIDGSVRERVSSILVKSRPFELVLHGTTGEVGRFRFRMPVAAARAGFLLSPFLATTPELGMLYARPESLPRVTSLRIEGEEASVTLTFHRVNLPEATGSLGERELRSAVLGVPLGGITGEAFFSKIKDAQGIVIAAPGALDLERPPGAAILRGGIAVDRWAYRLRAVEGALRFLVEDGEGVPLWEKTLHPAKRAADRGMIPFEVTLPEKGHGTIRLRVEAEGTLRQGFWTALEFAPADAGDSDHGAKEID